MFPLAIILFLIIALVLLLIAGIYDILGAQAVATFNSKDPNLISARHYLITSIVIAFVGAFLIILTIILTLWHRNKNNALLTLYGILTIFFIITLILILIVGILSIIASAKLSTPQVTKAHQNCVLASVFSIIGFVVLLILFIIMAIRNKKKD